MLKIKDNIDLNELKKFGFKLIDSMLIPRYKRGRIRIYYDIDVKMNMSIEKMNELRDKNHMTRYYNRVLYIERNKEVKLEK